VGDVTKETRLSARVRCEHSHVLTWSERTQICAFPRKVFGFSWKDFWDVGVGNTGTADFKVRFYEAAGELALVTTATS
jgi:hypothetical protein